MINKIREWFAIHRIRRGIRHLSPEKQVEVIAHAFMQVEINKEINKVLLQELKNFALKDKSEVEE